jgi:hypothetical protein
MHPDYTFEPYDEDHILGSIINGCYHNSFPQYLTYLDVVKKFVEDDRYFPEQNDMQHLVEMLCFKLNLKGDNNPKLDECLYILINRLPDKVFSQAIDDGPALLDICYHFDKDIFEVFFIRHCQLFPEIHNCAMLLSRGVYKFLKDGKGQILHYRYLFDVACDSYGIDFVTNMCYLHMTYPLVLSYELENLHIPSKHYERTYRFLLAKKIQRKLEKDPK